MFNKTDKKNSMKITQIVSLFSEQFMRYGKKLICRIRPEHGAFIKNQKGQAIVELALMMPLLAIILMGLVITYELSSKQVSALVTIRNDMRHSMNDNARDSFKKNIKQQTINVDVPGKMKWFFGTPFISQTLKIEFYEGSYHGKKKNKYHRYGTSLRKINL